MMLFMIFLPRQYVQTKAKGTLLKETKDHSIFEETVAMLEDMEDSTLKLLMTIVANTAKVAVQLSHKCRPVVFLFQKGHIFL